MKKLLVLVAVAALVMACGNQKEQDTEGTPVQTAEFNTQAPDLLGELVTIEGTVQHVCRNGGKKFFVSEDRIKVIASDAIPVFDQSLEGSDVVVTGFIREEVMQPVISDEEKVRDNHPKDEGDAAHQMDIDTLDSAEAEDDCDFESATTLYVLEVKEVKEVATK